MPRKGWDLLLSDVPRYHAHHGLKLEAYSEFMPPPRIGWRPYGTNHPAPRNPGNPYAWLVSERETVFELQPGLQIIAGQVMSALQHLDRDESAEGISRWKLEGNEYWPAELRRLGAIPHEHYVTLMPLALSRTQDDKGRVRWTFFGGSEQGPDRAFWKSFYESPGKERLPEYAVDFIRRLLSTVYNEPQQRLTNLRLAGFRILPGSGEGIHSRWQQEPLPSWTKPFILQYDEPLEGVKYLLTFRPFGSLPESVQKAYLAGRLHLLPFPGSLIFWGVPPFLRMEEKLRLATQIPLLNVCERREAVRGLRILQSGWMVEPPAGEASTNRSMSDAGGTYRRTHRWERVERHKDDLSVKGLADRVSKVLFSCDPVDVDLYSKPMARNAQIWTDGHEVILDGPRADREALTHAAELVKGGGRFGYRFYYPPMLVGKYDVFWHVPLVSFLDPKTGKAKMLEQSPLGYLTAYDTQNADLVSPVELWPELRRRPEVLATVRGYKEAYEHRDHQFALNAHKLLEVSAFLGDRSLPWDFARSIVNLPREQKLDQWLEQVAEWNVAGGYGVLVNDALRRIIIPQSDAAQRPLPDPLTYQYTANRAFEESYWMTIAQLATGQFLNKDNADCVDDQASQTLRKRSKRDLEALGDWILDYYRTVIASHGMRGKADAGDLPFTWRTDFEFPWMGGWRANQPGKACERNLLFRIPGNDHGRAVIMADHYDTAYMEDVYYKERGGTLARVSAAGADDNHSATAALLLAAPVFLKLSRAGKLACDVWLVHLTGEEFPADCMGARDLARQVIERSLRLRVRGKKPIDLSQTVIEGVFVLDMIAHNRFPDRDVFQLAPGLNPRSFWLAYQAHLANMIWNSQAQEWNEQPDRRSKGRGQRSSDPFTLPEIARHSLLRGEVRIPRDPRSSLYNTDGQIFSDVGIPVVLFMENYDINRTGYHDTKDNMGNIDLDYGSALAAIAIESVARVAHDPVSPFR
jgi:hypothetical protein